MVDKSIPAGWYPVEQGSGELRYWDGAQWTEHRTAVGQMPADEGPIPTETNKIAQLQDLVELRKSAGLSDTEFNVLKAELLGDQVGETPIADPEPPVTGPAPPTQHVGHGPEPLDADVGHLNASVRPLLAHLNETTIVSRAEAARAAAVGSWRSNVLTPVFRDRMLVVSGTAWTRLEPNTGGVWSPAESGGVDADGTNRTLAEIADGLIAALNQSAPDGDGDIMGAVFDVRWLGLITNSRDRWTTFTSKTLLTLKRGVESRCVGYSSESGTWEIRKEPDRPAVQQSSVATYSVPRREPGASQGHLTTARTNGFAVASLVLGLVGVSLLAIIFGHVARGQISRSAGSEKGEGMALAGLILGYAWLLLVVIILMGLSSASSGYQ